MINPLKNNTYQINHITDTGTAILIKTDIQHIAHCTQIGWDTYTDHTVLSQITQLINRHPPK